MRRKDILDAAAACVLSDREQQYGAPEDVFGVIAGLWSVYLDHTVRPHDVAAMMVLLKVARLTGNAAHDDSWTDIAGYAACGGELAVPVERVMQAPEMGLGPK